MNLEPNYYRKYRIMINLSVILILRISFPIVWLGFIVLLTVFMYIAYIDDVNYNLPAYIFWWIYYCFCEIQVIATIFGYLIFIGVMTLYLIFRFNDINENLKSISHNEGFNYVKIRKVIDDYHWVALSVIEYNKLFVFKILNLEIRSLNFVKFLARLVIFLLYSFYFKFILKIQMQYL